MKSRLYLALLGSAGLIIGATGVASAQECSDQIALLQQEMMGSSAGLATGSADPSAAASSSTNPLQTEAEGSSDASGVTATEELAASDAEAGAAVGTGVTGDVSGSGALSADANAPASTSTNPLQTETEGSSGASGLTATEELESDDLQTGSIAPSGNAEFDAALSEAIAADARADSAACLDAVARARAAM
jgi:hypothetical protein